MKVHLQYGKQGLDVDIPSANVHVIAPKFVAGLPEEAASFRDAVRKPIGAKPLKDCVSAHESVAIVIPDITRPLPTDRLLRWLFAELAHVPVDNFTIVNGTGSHRANTPQELSAMLGSDIATRYRVVNHTAHEPTALLYVGESSDGHAVLMNKEYVLADRRIVLGFIEPHFMAGFSGGYKGVFPAIADIDSIMHFHRAEVIGNAHSIWGLLDGNPTQHQIRHNGSLVPVDFLINVTLNHQRQITSFFCGETLAAHKQGCAFAKQTAMQPCCQPFEIVVTTNGGYPLDQNLYQTVKGMSAAKQIVTAGGLIVTASRCNDGFPFHGNFRQLLFNHASPQALLDKILSPGFSLYDQWEAQLLAMIRLKARVALLSELPPDDVRRAHLEPIADVSACITEELQRIGENARIAVLPEGPMTIPHLEAGINCVENKSIA